MDVHSFYYCQKLVVFSPDGQSVLLCKRQGEADYDGVFSFIGGKMQNTDASFIEGARREKNEEIGETAKLRLATTFTHNVMFRRKDGTPMVLPHLYCEFVEGEITLNPNEYSEFKWVPIADLPAFEPKVENVTEKVDVMLRLKPLLKPDDFTLI